MYWKNVNSYNIAEVKAMDKVLLKQIGDRIRDFRENINYTRESFAEKAGISPQFLAEIENGKKRPSDKILYTYSRHLGLPKGFIPFVRHFLFQPIIFYSVAFL